MSANSEGKTIWVATTEPVDVRGDQFTQLDIDNFAGNVNIFLENMGTVLQKTPEKMGKFQFVEFEFSAEISAEGQIILMGTGGKVGASGGLKFIFRRSPSVSE